MRKRALLISILSILVFSTISSWALSPSNSAWFLDSRRTVNYCVIRSESFSATEADVHAAISWSLSRWASYIESMKLNQRPQALTLAVQFRQGDNCDSADLKFYFGVQNAEIEKYRDQEFFHPISFARRISYDAKAGWGKGLIWLTNEKEFYDSAGQLLSVQWSKSISLKGILLHEMGHVFGVGHWDGTVMREKIIENLISQDIYGNTHIPNAWELYSPTQASWKSGDQYDQLGEMTPAAFSRLFGRAPQGQIRGQWLADSNRILVQDDLGQYLLNTKFVYERQNQIPEMALFYAFRKNEANQVESKNESRKAFVKIGMLTSLSGEQLNIIVEQNTAERHFKISFQANAGGGFQDLFSQPCKMVTIPIYNSQRCIPVYPGDEG